MDGTIFGFGTMQATRWELISPNGAKPSGREHHVAAWSDAANGFYIHGGWWDGSAGSQEVGWATSVSEAIWRSCGSSAARLGFYEAQSWNHAVMLGKLSKSV